MNSSFKKIIFNCSCVTQIIVLLLLATVFSRPVMANDGGVIELSKSSRSETLGDVYTFGLYSSLGSRSMSGFYAGMQLVMLDNNDVNEIDSTIKIFIGQSVGKTFAPFYEIGTGLYGFLTLFNNDNETHTCTEEKDCSIDVYFRIGVRIKLNDNLAIGVFHENIDFGAFHTNLSGDHRYVGSSLAISF